MSKLYVLGGRQRKLGTSEATPEDEWYLYEAALIVEIDTDSGAVRTCVEYQSPPEARAGSHPAAHFHSGTVIGNKLYTCTTTEVLAYQLPHFDLVEYISLPCFNDLHHVTLSRDGNLLVVNTGLDMVLRITRKGEILDVWNVLGDFPWGKFSQDIDYRKVETTKPHSSHPNYVFELHDEVWATRFHQRDAICLSNLEKRIEINGEYPHDGFIWGDQILFTAVDGKIMEVNQSTLRVERTIDLRQIQDHGRQVLPAWCRGLLPVADQQIWIGFTRIRKTLFREHVRWVKSVLREGTVVKPTHIALFDIQSQQCLKEFDLEPHGMNTIFSILPAGSGQ